MSNAALHLSGTGRALAARLLRWLFCLLLVVVVVPSGSVDFNVLHPVAAGFFGLALLGTIIGGHNRSIRSAYAITLSVALVIGLWIVIQASSIAGNPFANPIWADAERFYGPMAQSISVSPGDTFQGLIAALLPFSAFMTVLLIFQNDKDAVNLIRFFVVSGCAICVVALLQFLLFPGMLLFVPKKFYLDSLTAVFVNRNTAATYLAMVMIFSGGLAFHSLQNAGFVSFIRFLINSNHKTRRSDALLVIFYVTTFALALTALMLTKSRAGIAAGITGSCVTGMILAYYGGQSATHSYHRGFSRPRTSLIARLMRVGLVLLAMMSVGLVFGGQAIVRAGVQGTGDVRFCFLPTLIDMTRDNWLVGTGFGTFRDVFPAYRDPACGGFELFLSLAHNFYLEGWISLGLPFVITALIVVAALIHNLFIGLRERRRYRWIPAAGLGVLTLHLLHNSVDFSIQNPGVGVMFAALMAATVVIARGRSTKSKRSEILATEEPPGPNDDDQRSTRGSVEIQVLGGPAT
ncbi:MAG: Lipid core -O-antigen ligase [Rhizobium sp.]|nr:Lipid core -O-antigen ligase [Rhizobium sp.]